MSEEKMTREQTQAKILAELDKRVWKTADDCCQIRCDSRYEVECIRMALASLDEQKAVPQSGEFTNRKPEANGEGPTGAAPMPEEPSTWYPYHPNGDAFVLKSDYDALRAEAERLRGDAERAFHRIERAMMPDPNDEREISVDWLRKEIRAAIDAARKEQP